MKLIAVALSTLFSCASALPNTGPLVKRDTCGKNGGMICPAPLCCSSSGYCGTSLAYCSIGCQVGYGNCIASSGNPPNLNYYPSNGLPLVCGPGFGGLSCPGSLCCSVAGYCGQTAPYCGIGCDSAFGSCWNLTSVGGGGGGNGASNGGITLGPELGAATSSVKPTKTTTATSAAPKTSIIPFDDTCGPTPCAHGFCCSKWGYCGTSALHCSPGTCKYNCVLPPVSVSSSVILAPTSTVNWSAATAQVMYTRNSSTAPGSVVTASSSERSITFTTTDSTQTRLMPQSSVSPAISMTYVYATTWKPVSSTLVVETMTPSRSSSVVVTSVSPVQSTSVVISTASVLTTESRSTQSASTASFSETMRPSQTPSVVTVWSTHKATKPSTFTKTKSMTLATSVATASTSIASATTKPVSHKSATAKSPNSTVTTPSTAWSTKMPSSTMPVKTKWSTVSASATETITMSSIWATDTIWPTSASVVVDPVWTSVITESILISPRPAIQTIWLTYTSFIETESASQISTALTATNVATPVLVIDPMWPSIMPTSDANLVPVYETLWLTVIETVWPSPSQIAQVSVVQATTTSISAYPILNTVTPTRSAVTTKTDDSILDETATPDVSGTAPSKRKKTKRTHVVATAVVGGGGGVVDIQVTMTPSAGPVIPTPANAGDQTAPITLTTTLNPDLKVTSIPTFTTVETPSIVPPLYAILAPFGGRCGNGIYCQPGQCCSVFGYCGITSAHCYQPTCHSQCNKFCIIIMAETGYVIFDTSLGSFSVELYWDEAPKSCKNFYELAQRGYYDGTIFHRIIPDFMIQCGDPTGTGRGGSSIYGPTFEDEITPRLKHTGAGIVSMANAGPNTNGSQFFITLAPTPWLDGKHTIFGRIRDGIKVVGRLGLIATDSADRPVEDVKIIKAHVKEA